MTQLETTKAALVGQVKANFIQNLVNCIEVGVTIHVSHKQKMGHPLTYLPFGRRPIKHTNYITS